MWFSFGYLGQNKTKTPSENNIRNKSTNVLENKLSLAEFGLNEKIRKNDML